MDQFAGGVVLSFSRKSAFFKVGELSIVVLKARLMSRARGIWSGDEYEKTISVSSTIAKTRVQVVVNSLMPLASMMNTRLVC